MEGLQRAFILGKERDIFFGMPAIEYVYSKIPADALKRLGDGAFQVSDIKTIAHFIYAGLLGGAERKDDMPDFEFSNIYDTVEAILLNGDENNVLAAVAKAFSESNTVKWAASKKKKEEAKPKKSTGRK